MGIIETYLSKPELQTDIKRASLQLIGWVFLRPSAWQNYLASIDSELPPDFSLVELSRQQWRQPQFRKLVVSQFFCLLLINTLGVVFLSIFGVPVNQAIRAAMFSLTFGAILSLSGSLASGIASSVVVSILGIIYTLITSSTGPSLKEAAVIEVSTGALAAGIVGSTLIRLSKNKSKFSLTRTAHLKNIGTTLFIFISLIISAALLTILTAIVFGIIPLVANDFGLGGYVQRGGYETFIITIVIVFIVLAASNLWRLRARKGELLATTATGISGGLASIVAFAVAIIVMISTLLIDSPGLGSIASGARSGLVGGIIFGVLFTLPYTIAENKVGLNSGAVVGSLVSGLAWIAQFVFPFFALLTAVSLLLLLMLSLGLGEFRGEQLLELIKPYVFPEFGLSFMVGVGSILVGLTFFRWLPILLWPIQVILSYSLFRADRINFNRDLKYILRTPAFWHEHQWLPLFGLDEHLVLLFERNPEEGREAIAYFSASYQDWAAQAAQIELDARFLEECRTVNSIRSAHRNLLAGELDSPASALLRIINRISHDIDVALRQESNYSRRVSLRFVEEELDSFLLDLNRSKQKYEKRFRPIVNTWRRLVAEYWRELQREGELREEIDNPYIVGPPLPKHQATFVVRKEIGLRLEQLLRDHRPLPLLLYGQRRMGKTSLLLNLSLLLQSHIVPFFVDLQGGPAQAQDHAGLFYNISDQMIKSARQERRLNLPVLTREELSSDPFTVFGKWFDQVEESLGKNTALLSLDEFESLDLAFKEDRFDMHKVLGMLRHIIQHHIKFKILLSGSHTLEEYRHWSSYLVNVQLLHVDYLRENEARQLIEEPIKNSALRYEEAAVQRILNLTRCHPFLVQLLCREIVNLKNRQTIEERYLVTQADIEAVVTVALTNGNFFFSDLEVRNRDDAAILDVLYFVAQQGEGNIVDREELANRFSQEEVEQGIDRLLRQDLLESINGGYRFQVELVRRWFAERFKPAQL